MLKNPLAAPSLTQKVSRQLYHPSIFWNSDFVEDEFLCSNLLEEKDHETFLSFARQMLTWLPEERKTARELMGQPFLKLGG
jgi:hypothetical protein